MIEIIDKKDCCGCFACSTACPKRCIEMKEDPEGFQYPFVDNSLCIDCKLCEKVCPVLNAKPDIPKAQRAFLIQHKDPQVLKESTSGGAFTAIASWVINQGGVVFGAAYDEKFEVTHQYTEDVQELGMFRNSKYVQSFIGEAYKKAEEFLMKGRMVCFSGTPCQLEGLLGFLGKPYENLVAADIMCHSVTSPGVFRSYRLYKSEGLDVIPEDYKFRDKDPYGYKYSMMSIYSNGKQVYHEGAETDKYLRSFLSDINVRPSCYDCKFKKRYHLTDFTMWDCFIPSKFNKEFDNDKGVTRLLVNSNKGVNIIHELSSVAMIAEIDADAAVEGVKEMNHSVRINSGRAAWFADFTVSQGDSSFWKKCFPTTVKSNLNRILRRLFIRMGVYMQIKKIIKSI